MKRKCFHLWLVTNTSNRTHYTEAEVCRKIVWPILLPVCFSPPVSESASQRGESTCGNAESCWKTLDLFEHGSQLNYFYFLCSIKRMKDKYFPSQITVDSLLGQTSVRLLNLLLGPLCTSL